MTMLSKYWIDKHLTVEPRTEYQAF